MNKRFSFVAAVICLLLAVCACAAASAETEGDWEYEADGGWVRILHYLGHDTELDIPEEIGGMPVRIIGKQGSIIEDYETRQLVTAVRIPDSVVCIADSAFISFSSMETVRLPEHLLTIRYYAFAYCGLKQINLPPQLISIESHAFAGNEALEEIVFPETLEAIEDGAFRGCVKLRKADLPENVERIGAGAFCGTDIPEDQFRLPETMKDSETLHRYYYRAADSFEEHPQDGLWITYLVTPEGEADVVQVRLTDKITKLTIPEKLGGYPVTKISSTEGEGYGGGSVVSLQLPKTLREIGQFTFSHYGIKEVTIPEGVTRIGAFAFQYCENLQKIKLPSTLRFLGYNVAGWTPVDQETLRQSAGDAEKQSYVSLMDFVGSDDPDFTDGSAYYKLPYSYEDGPLRLQYIQPAPGKEDLEPPETCLGLPVYMNYGSSWNTGGIQYAYAGDCVYPLKIIDSANWDGSFPETVLGLPVNTEYLSVTFTSGPLECLLSEVWLPREEGEKERKSELRVSVTGVDPETWDGTLPGTILGYPVNGVGEGFRVEDGDYVFGYVASGTGKEEGISVIRYTGNGKEVWIPESFKGLAVTGIGPEAFAHLPELETVHIPDTVLFMQSKAFYDCPKLTTVDHPEQWAAYIYENACVRIGMKTIRYGDKWNRNKTISTAEPVPGTDYALFSDGTAEIISLNDKNLAAGKIPETIDGHTVTALGTALYSSSKLSKVQLPETLEIIGERCFSFSGLTAVDIPGSVKIIADDAFSNAEKLKTVTLHEGTEIIRENAFAYCRIAKLTVPASMRAIESGAFSGLKAPLDLTFLSSDIQVDPGMFGDVYSVRYGEQSIGIDYTEALVNPFKAPVVTIHTVPGSNPDRVLVNPLMIKKVYPKEKEMVTVTADAGPVLTAAGVPDGDWSILVIPEGVEEIAAGALKGKTNLYKVSLPASLKTIGDEAFSGCGGLQEVTFAKGAQLTNIGQNAFADCVNLKEMKLPDSVTVIQKAAFMNGRSLKKINLPAGVTRIEESTFADCPVLTPAGLKIGKQVEYIGPHAFHYCEGLKGVKIPASAEVDPQAFSSCSWY